jgi:hypothetical protein
MQAVRIVPATVKTTLITAMAAMTPGLRSLFSPPEPLADEAGLEVEALELEDGNEDPIELCAACDVVVTRGDGVEAVLDGPETAADVDGRSTQVS